MIALGVLITSQTGGLRRMHLVKAALAAHRIRLDIMDPRPGIK